MSKKSIIGSALGQGVDAGAGMLQDKVNNPFAKMAIGLGGELLGDVIENKLGPKPNAEKKEQEPQLPEYKTSVPGSMVSTISSGAGNSGGLFSRQSNLSGSVSGRPSAALSLLNQRR